jgi:hypothetical protein
MGSELIEVKKLTSSREESEDPGGEVKRPPEFGGEKLPRSSELKCESRALKLN